MTARTNSGAATISFPSPEEVLITRAFDAPPALIYRAWTTPELVRRWWGAGLGEVTVAEIDLRVGGRWRYVMLTRGGQEVAFHGEFRELVPDTRIVSTEVYEGMPDREGALNTLTFEASGGRTILTLRVRHANQDDRDAHIASGMEGGLQRSLDALEAVAHTLV